MSVTLTIAGGTGPGNQGASRPVFANAPRALYRVPFTITFDSSYPTGGESIAATITGSPYSVLRTIDHIAIYDAVAPGGTGGFSAGDIAHAIVDYTNKKVLLYINATQVTDTTNASLITLRGEAVGYA